MNNDHEVSIAYQFSDLSHEVFYFTLIDYVIEKACKTTEFDNNKAVEKRTIQFYLEEDDLPSDNAIENTIKFFASTVIYFENISFPPVPDSNVYDYTKILNKLGNIHFYACQFNCTYLNIRHFSNKHQIKLSYKACRFETKWNILNNTNTLTYDEYPHTLFNKCRFIDDVNIIGNILQDGTKTTKITADLFSDCFFYKELYIESTIIDSKIFTNTELKIYSSPNIDKLTIMNCSIERDFILNKIQINELLFFHNEFNSKFEFKHNTCKKYEETDTNHHGLYDAFDSKFDVFKVEKCIFKDFVGFEDCIFSYSNQSEITQSIFKYATFKSFVNFRNTHFNAGLDISLANFKETPNFLNSDIDSKNTNRETFRIIKHSFDSIGNRIEANKFFAYEMNKYKEEVSKTGTDEQKFILFFNEKISNFGQSYSRPLILLIITTFIHAALKFLTIDSADEFIQGVGIIFNPIAEAFIPVAKIAKNSQPALDLFFYVIYIPLIWQLIVAIKRHTRR